MNPPASPARIGDRIADVDTPALLIDLDAFDANVRAVHGYVAAHGGKLRSHGKAHKCSEIGRRQVAAGAVGLCCQKVGEAEAFVAGGITDVLVSNVVVGAGKAARIAALAKKARVGVCVDGPLQVEQLAAAARDAGATIDVLIEVDVGGGRCGVTEASEALALAQAIAAARPALRLRGLQAYQGLAQHLRTAQERAVAIGIASARASRVANALRDAGFEVDEVCGAGTGTYPYELASGVYTEIQAGSYVLMDVDYLANQVDADAPPLEKPLSGLCTVTTVRPGHAVLDGGHKAFAIDCGKPQVLEPGWTVRAMSDEHTMIVPGPDARTLAVGEKIRLRPSHCDPTVNLHDWLVAYRGDLVEAVWRVDARGALL